MEVKHRKREKEREWGEKEIGRTIEESRNGEESPLAGTFGYSLVPQFFL